MASTDGTQSGGLKVSDGGTVSTGGGDAYGGDKRIETYIEAPERDKSREMMAQTIENELKEKNKELEALKKENKSLSEKVVDIDNLLSTVHIMIGDHFVSVRHYVLYSAAFFLKMGRKDELLEDLFESRRGAERHV